MDTVIEILEDLCPDADVRTSTTLIDDRIIDSMTMLALVAELEDAFDVQIPAVEIMPANFNSASAIAALVERLQEEDED